MKSFKQYINEATYKVEVEGLPTMYVDAENPGAVKTKLRKLLKKPDMVTSIERVTPADVKKHFRMKAAGKDEMEEGNTQMKGKDPCWKGYQMVGHKKNERGQKVPNCVPEETIHEEAPANAVAHGGVDMNPTGKRKKFNDKRSRYDVTKMFRRANGK